MNGEKGEAAATCMRLLVTLGELFEADRMIPITSAHVSGVSYKNIGTAGLELLEELAGKGAKVQVKTTLNPTGMDFFKWREVGVKEEFAREQLRIVEAFRKMGLLEELTCIPYEAGNRPSAGEHVAWAESSALAYANSVLGARTNRESGISALASAAVGRTPYYGLHLDENRAPTLLVQAPPELEDPLEFSALGYFIGQNFGRAVPLIRGLKTVRPEGLKALGAGMAASGAVALYHVEGLTPEAHRFSEKPLGGWERLRVDRKDLEETLRKLSCGAEGGYDCVFLGCPHYSLRQLERLTSKVRGRRLRRRLWVCTSRKVYEEAERRGYVAAIEEAGGVVLRDTCMIVSPTEELGIDTVLTDSCKAAHYFPSLCRVKASLGTLDACVEAAVRR